MHCLVTARLVCREGSGTSLTYTVSLRTREEYVGLGNTSASTSPAPVYLWW
jgi:hypothetical protein